MKEEQHKNIDDILRRVIANPANEPEYLEDHWNALEEMLNDKKKPGKMVYWLPVIGAAAMVLMATGWWYFTSPTLETTTLKQRIVIKKSAGINTPQKKNVGAPLKVDSIVLHGRVNKTARLSGSPKQPMSAIKTGNAAQQKLVIAPGDKVNTGDDVLNNAGSRGNSITLPDPPRPFPLPTAGLAYQTIEPVYALENVATTTSNGVKAQANDASWFKKPRLAITVLSSADINGVNSFNNTSKGKNIGLLVSARFGKLSISTGAHYAFKPYTMPFAAYSPNSAYKFKYSPETVTADCRMLDIPLNVDYQIYSKNKNSVSVGTGLSSFIMLKESYQYNYASSRVYGLSSYNVNNPDKYLFSSVNFQANYQRQINSKIGLNVMPYLKVPLSTIGYSQIKLQTVGVAVGLNWNINTLPKPK